MIKKNNTILFSFPSSKTMRVKLIVTLTIVIAMVNLVQSFSAHSSAHHFFKHRTKPREIRGFKPDSIHTAIGFGKREQAFELSKLDRRERIMISSLLRNFPCGWTYTIIICKLSISYLFLTCFSMISEFLSTGRYEKWKLTLILLENFNKSRRTVTTMNKRH